MISAETFLASLRFNTLAYAYDVINGALVERNGSSFTFRPFSDVYAQSIVGNMFFGIDLAARNFIIDPEKVTLDDLLGHADNRHCLHTLAQAAQLPLQLPSPTPYTENAFFRYEWLVDAFAPYRMAYYQPCTFFLPRIPAEMIYLAAKMIQQLRYYVLPRHLFVRVPNFVREGSKTTVFILERDIKGDEADRKYYFSLLYSGPLAPGTYSTSKWKPPHPDRTVISSIGYVDLAGTLDFFDTPSN